MNLIERYQDEMYSLALSLTNDDKKSKALAMKAFDKSVGELYGGYNKMKVQLFRTLLSFAPLSKLKRAKNGDILYTFKKNLPPFERQIFVLKFEFHLSVLETSLVLNSSRAEVKKHIFFILNKLFKKLEKTLK
ncbi:MAG: hypothetical protein LBB93_04055 [Elusimicrobiota bacterium]|nr:hypothetical protein [Elusimicrobiota bacterium]